MTDAEEQQLRELGEDLARAERSDYQPRGIARAFATPHAGDLVLTMQGWIDLDAARSPLLLLETPETIEDMETAVDAFRCGPIDLTPEEAASLMERMRDAVAEAFAMSIRMHDPNADESGHHQASGFGDWLPIMACLIGQIGMTRLDALMTPVRQAFPLIAGHRHNQGWELADASYAQRDAFLEGGEE